jgi:hypothetical protein
MTEFRAVSIDEVRSLVAERQRYTDWLTALDARRAETASHVFNRVHGDYVARCDAVMAQLREHIGALASHGDELDRRLSVLEAELATREDERVEAMLRTAVGEYDDHRWETLRQGVEAKLASLGDQRSGLLTEIDEIRSLLASAGNEPTRTVVAVRADDVLAVVTADVTEDVLGGVAVDSLGDRPAESALVASEPYIEIDITFGETPDVMADVRAAPASLDHVPAPEPAADQRTSDFDDALAMFAEVPGTPDPTVTRSLEGVGVERGGQGASSRSAPSAPQASTATAAPAEAGGAFDDLAFLKSVIDPTPAASSVGVSSVGVSSVAEVAPPSEPLKTLRCTECGTMNLPTEWYCERCGGELAAF